ncbi:serine hydrolase [Paenibacillus sp. GCM10023248]|uniref:serine hydrolase domain-containing protein n=1 Tax=unclassified Paenibacillus TaxID=185978 RepID=UPI00237812C1|nr:serine hydrolase domain-containing protein [Paenibacillus sp. MAHUQ-63]MDD9267184.1 serine hydrolase [Paenibacillus sp. MAHUQ-63]
MTTARKIIPAFLISSLLALFILAIPSSAVESKSKKEIVAEIDEFVRNNMEVNHISGASLSITYGEDDYYTQGYGAYAHGARITSTTPFPIASLSKAMTALAVLQLADKGLIDLDAPFASYFPDIAAADNRVARITVRHLLNQTSGLNDKVNPDMTKSNQFQSLQEILKSLELLSLANDPGETYSYHNPNYQFLALLVEQVSGQPFSEYLHDHIFEPIGMHDTFSVSTTQQINEDSVIARGHYLLFGKPISTSEPLWFIEGPAGVISTAEDMAKWMRAQYATRLLSPNLMQQYHAAEQQTSYGMGWLASLDTDWGRTISHSGIFWTYKAEETVYLEKKLGIAMMFDTGLNAFIDYSGFISGIAQIMDGGKAKISVMHSRNIEAALILLPVAAVLWKMASIYLLKKSKKRLRSYRWKLIVATVITFTPLILLLFLSPILTFIGGGRVVPWSGIWMMMPSVVLLFIFLFLVNIVSLICRYRIYSAQSKY